MTINTGQGANSAIEDVAHLTNMLHGLLGERREKKPSQAEIEALLQQFCKERLPRMRVIDSLSRATVRTHAQVTFRQRLLTRYVMPYLGGLVQARIFAILASGPILNYLPPKGTEFPGWEKYREKKKKSSTGIQVAVLLAVAALVAASAWYGWGPQDWPGWRRVAFH